MEDTQLSETNFRGADLSMVSTLNIFNHKYIYALNKIKTKFPDLIITPFIQEDSI